ncbi:DUF4381 domain-containing protein [Congregibacter sp.]|uniref:DUF4381 domain-containing protein n=1 Tax=Congregibacter sp. TaxID=2744308 RepID=UPI003F6B50C6
MTELFGPGWGNYAIRGILETALPEPVSLVPTTPGWWVLLGLVIGSAAYGGWARWQRYQNNAYRREAQQALDTLEARVRSGERECLRELAPLLRATALAAVDNRDSVASLSGAAWEETLLQMAPTVAPLPVARLNALAYGPYPQASENLEGLFKQIREWIRLHEGAHD